MERKLGLSSRNENSRNMLVPDMHVSKLDEMYEQFCKNVETVKEKFHIAEQLDNVHEEKAVKDIYRSQIVFLESALDYYMHCLGIYAMVQMYNNHWDKTRGYSDLKVPIDKVMDAVIPKIQGGLTR